jgi:hypothetical protein
MARTLTIAVSHQSGYVPNVTDGFRVRVEVIEATEMPAAVFRYWCLPPRPGDVERTGYCDGVCSSVDLEQMPETEPDPADAYGAFRLPYWDQILPAQSLAAGAVARIKLELRRLIQSLNAQDAMTQVEVVVVGA